MESKHCSAIPVIKQEYFENDNIIQNIKIEDQEYGEENIMNNKTIIKQENADGLMKLKKECFYGIQEEWFQQQTLKWSENQISNLKARDRSIKNLEEKVRQLTKEKEAIKKEFYDYKKGVKNLQKKYEETIEKFSETTNENTKLRENDQLRSHELLQSKIFGKKILPQSSSPVVTKKIKLEKCNWCQFKSVDDGRLKTHIKKKHQQCDICDISFKTSVSQRQHMRLKHDKEPNTKPKRGPRVNPSVTQKVEFNKPEKLLTKSQMLAYRVLRRRERMPEILFTSKPDWSYFSSVFKKEYH